MTTVVWIEPVLRPDGRPWWVAKGERTAKSGLLLRTRLGGPDGEILCDRMFNPVCESCRALMACGIVGPFETRKPDIDYPCMIGDIEMVAGLTVKEPDDGVVHFAGWRPFNQSALSPLSHLGASARSARPRYGGGAPTRTPLYGRTRS